MNTTVATFMKIGLTATTIALLLFGIAYTLSSGEATHYKTEVTNQQSKLPTTP